MRAARWAVYGVVVGLVAGVPLGVTLSTGRTWIPDFAGLDAGALRRRHPLDAFDTAGLTVPADHIQRGGPPKDGIPALVEPATVPVADAGFLTPEDRVIGVTVAGATRAYPIRLLNYHEIVNDELGGVPIAVVYCPLCDSVSVVDRRVGGETLAFGVSGLLLHSNVLMYDRTHEALWTQVGGEALSGPHAGTTLDHVNTWEVTSFGVWADAHPEARVASFDTGHDRDYDRSPYADYFETDDLYFPVPRDARLPQRKVPVVGVRLGDRVFAIPVVDVADAPGGRLEVAIGADRVVLASVVGAPEVAIVEAPADARIVHTFWFAWAAFHPETTLHGRTPTARPAGGS